MKILLVGRKGKYNAEFFYEKAFRILGHEVLLADSYQGLNHELLRRFLHTRTGAFDFTLGSYWINRQLPVIVESFDPDAVLFFKGEFISPYIIEQISQNRDVYLFYPDTYKFKPLLRRFIRGYKAVFTASNRTDFYYHMGARNVVTVPWGCDPDFHRPINLEKIYKVTFIGTAYLERRRIIRSVGNIDVFGDFWFGFGNNAHESVYGEDYVKTINKSIINLNLQASISIEADAPTMRTFEIAGCGGFQISDYMSSIKRYFPVMPTFKNKDELKERIEYYLDNNEERKEIALKSMETCKDSFKYTDSAKIILSEF